MNTLNKLFFMKFLLLGWLFFGVGEVWGQYKIETVVGILNPNNEEKLAVNSNLHNPKGMATDGLGDIYIADTDNHRIRKLSLHTGLITTVAGITQNQGYSGDGGLAIKAQLNYPTDVALDNSENIYVADSRNYCIRKIDASTGIITTIAGTGVRGLLGDGGLATQAQFNKPISLSVDYMDNLYIVDQENQCIKKVSAKTGIITTVAGLSIGSAGKGYSGDGGLATKARLNYPTSVEVDFWGRVLYIADAKNHRIRKVNISTGIITTIAGTGSEGYSGDGGKAILAEIGVPENITLNFDDIFISDSKNNCIRKISPGGRINTVVGTGSSGYSGDGTIATLAKLNSPSGIAVDVFNNIYFADEGNHRLRQVSSLNGIISTIAGNGYLGDGIATSARLNHPKKIALDDFGNIYIADKNNHAIRKINVATGNIITIAGGNYGYAGDGGIATSAKLRFPTGITVDAKGNVYIADTDNHCIRKIDAITQIITTIAGNGTQGFSGDGGSAIVAQLDSPSGIAVDRLGNVFIVDENNYRIRQINALTGTITTIAGNGTQGFSGDGGLAELSQIRPSGISLDRSGNIYITDNQRIRKITLSTGVINTVAGSSTYSNNIGDGDVATSARLNNPLGVTLDNTGNLYIADQLHHRIRKVSIGNNFITTIAGNGAVGFSKDGILATDAKLNTPSDVVVSAAGIIYAVEEFNHRIVKVSPIPEINLTQADTSIINQDLYDFGKVPQRFTREVVFTIQNLGLATLRIGQIQVSGDFNISQNSIPINIEANSSANILVNIDSKYLGTKQGVLTIKSDDLDEEVYTVNLKGSVERIDKKDQIISFTPIDPKTMGDTSFTLNASTNSGLGIIYYSSNPSVASISGNVVTIIGAGKTIITASQEGNAFFNAAPDIHQPLVVNKALQIIYFDLGDNATKKVNDEAFNLNAIGGASGKTITYTSSNHAVATVSDNVINIVNSGVTFITASQAGNVNYEAALDVTQKLVVNKLGQTIAFNLGSDSLKSLNSPPFTLLAANSSGLPVLFKSSNSNVAEIKDNVVTITGLGSTIITAYQTGNPTYDTVSVSQTLRVVLGSIDNFTSEIQGRNSIKLNWRIDLRQIRQTRLERSEGTPDNFKEIITDNITSYLDTSLSIKPGVTYYYRAIAKGDGGIEAIPSDTIGVKIPKEEVVTGVTSTLLKNLQINPNPSSGIFQISWPSAVSRQKVTLVLTDAQGRVLRRYATLPKQINLQRLPSGVYYLNITTPEGEVVKKLVKK